MVDYWGDAAADSHGERAGYAQLQQPKQPQSRKSLRPRRSVSIVSPSSVSSKCSARWQRLPLIGKEVDFDVEPWLMKEQILDRVQLIIKLSKPFH